MARAHRVAVYASAFLLIYLLVFLAVLPVPFLEPDIVAQLLPVVRNASCSGTEYNSPPSRHLDPLVAARLVWRLLSRVSRLGTVHV